MIEQENCNRGEGQLGPTSSQLTTSPPQAERDKQSRDVDQGTGGLVVFGARNLKSKQGSECYSKNRNVQLK